MNFDLQKLFLSFYAPDLTENHESGASSKLGTQNLRPRMKQLFNRHSIESIFDAGCNDCNWMSLVTDYVDYQGGDISPAMIDHVRKEYPELDVISHDITTDPIPNVDLLFIRDVAIHLNNEDKLRVWKNWLSSNVPWILITHNREVSENTNFQYSDQFPFSSANWELDPWNFPKPLDFIDEYESNTIGVSNGRCMGLWHKDQFKGIL